MKRSDFLKLTINNMPVAPTINGVEIPQTTDDQPYIKFSFDKNGKMSLSTTSSWWGGIDSGFTSSEGYEGNSCKPKDLIKYISAYKENKIKEIIDEITVLQGKLEMIQTKWG